MASVSLSITVAQIEDINPENITVGSSVPGAGDVELRVNTANVHEPQADQSGAGEARAAFIEDQNYGPVNFKEL
jgi:hypothetical protein